MSKHITMTLWYICGLLILGVGATQEANAGVGATQEANAGVGATQGANAGVGATEGASANKFCGEPQNNYPRAICYIPDCTNAIKNHIKHEFNAAFKYLYMGALYGQYIVERPGMTNFFLESATEERGHAIQMMDYLVMRGLKYHRNYTFTNNELWKPDGEEVTELKLKTLSIESALEEALKMEIEVTKKINAVVESCANDFHAADVFTNPILEEQHTGMRKLQGAIRTIKDLLIGHPGIDGRRFAEYIFDQKMLKGEL